MQNHAFLTKSWVFSEPWLYRIANNKEITGEIVLLSPPISCLLFGMGCGCVSQIVG
jgi:hypothetical protein